jgi:hypothetical protein
MTVVSHAPSTKSSGAHTLKINVDRNGTDKIIFYFNMFSKILTSAFIYLFKLICSIPGPSWDTLWVWDLRTFRPYSIEIQHNAVDAIQFRKISPLPTTAPIIEHLSAGLTVLDEGYKNTAVVKSQITHIDGNKGTLSYRGYTVGYLFENHDYEEVSYLLIFGELPTREQKYDFRARLAAAMIPDPSVMRAVRAFDLAAHHT